MKKLMFTLMAAAMTLVPATAQNRVKYLSTTSETLNVSELQVADQSVQISRYLFAGYNTLCLPMTLNAEQLQAAAKNVRVERLAAIKQEGSKLNLYFVDCTAEGIQAGLPYLVYSPTAQSMRARSNDAVSISTDILPVTLSDNAGNRVSFCGSYVSLTGEGNRYGIPAKQDVEILESVLLPTSADKTFLPTRCGITWELQTATATQMEVKHAVTLDEVTAITAITGAQSDKAIYDLSGRRSNGAQKGIYVVDGKKKAVK